MPVTVETCGRSEPYFIPGQRSRARALLMEVLSDVMDTAGLPPPKSCISPSLNQNARKRLPLGEREGYQSTELLFYCVTIFNLCWLACFYAFCRGLFHLE